MEREGLHMPPALTSRAPPPSPAPQAPCWSSAQAGPGSPWVRLTLHAMVLFSSEPESLEGRNHVWVL